MLRSAPSAILLVCLMFAGCSRVSREQLIGTWRAEDDEGVTETAFRPDGTYSEWTQSNTVLHTPGVIIESGDWTLAGRQLDMTPKTTNSVEVGDATHLTIESLGHNRLVAKPAKGPARITARRMKLPECSGRADPATTPLASIIVGDWRVHYRTHDYEESYKPDKTVSISAHIGADMQTIHQGTWHVDGSTLVLALAKRGEYNRPIISFAQDCITFTDDGLPYTLERIK